MDHPIQWVERPFESIKLIEEQIEWYITDRVLWESEGQIVH